MAIKCLDIFGDEMRREEIVYKAYQYALDYCFSSVKEEIKKIYFNE